VSSVRIVIAPAKGAKAMEAVRGLFLEYQKWLEVDLCFQDFEEELAGLPGLYRPPNGGLWLARVDGRLAGCIGLRPLKDGDCEMKRLWVRPDYRGLGLGRRLAETCIGSASAGGYRAICLDTLAFMSEARVLYASLGFQEIPAYYDNPLEDVRYMRLELAAGGAGLAQA
jgi:ribosomal protein S18 acetylase RimI-like enzyme